MQPIVIERSVVRVDVVYRCVCSSERCVQKRTDSVEHRATPPPHRVHSADCSSRSSFHDDRFRLLSKSQIVTPHKCHLK